MTRLGRLPSIVWAVVLVAGSAQGQAPWEFWKGPHVLPLLATGDQVVLRSSYCPSGCRYDRTSEGDTRFLRLDGEEQVILEETGPGAITRIWMTAGWGISEPFDPSVRVRIRVDGVETPVVDLPLPDFFSGNVAPFLAPLAAGRELSSGGNVSYVPIPFRTGCRVSLVNALAYRLWFQFNVHRLAVAGDVVTFTGLEDNSVLARLLANPGADLVGDSLAGPGRSLDTGGNGWNLRSASHRCGGRSRSRPVAPRPRRHREMGRTVQRLRYRGQPGHRIHGR